MWLFKMISVFFLEFNVCWDANAADHSSRSPSGRVGEPDAGLFLEIWNWGGVDTCLGGGGVNMREAQTSIKKY